MDSKKAVIFATNVSKYPTQDVATGFWLGEVTHFYDELINNGWEVDIASPKGGYCPIEPKSLQQGMEACDWKYFADPTFQKKISNSLKPSEVKAEDYKVLYFAGGHGPVWDFYEPGEIHELARKVYENGGIVSAVCHGPAGLINVKLSDGEYLVKDKKLTCFSNVEEVAIKLDKAVPYSLEDELVKRGAKFEQGEAWGPHAVEDRRLITGQNPASCRPAAKLVVAHKW